MIRFLLSFISPMLPLRDVVDSGTMPAKDSSPCIYLHYIGSKIEDLGATLTGLAFKLPAPIVDALYILYTMAVLEVRR
jgi:hypothetical protein